MCGSYTRCVRRLRRRRREPYAVRARNARRLAEREGCARSVACFAGSFPHSPHKTCGSYTRCGRRLRRRRREPYAVRAWTRADLRRGRDAVVGRRRCRLPPHSPTCGSIRICSRSPRRPRAPYVRARRALVREVRPAAPAGTPRAVRCARVDARRFAEREGCGRRAPALPASSSQPYVRIDTDLQLGVRLGATRGRRVEPSR